MASPVDSNRGGFQLTTAGTSASPSLLAGTAGQMLVVAIRFAGAPGAVTYTGFTLLGSAMTTDASDDETRVYYRLLDGTEGVMSVTWVSAQKMAGVRWLVTGAEDPATAVPTISTVAIGTTAANTADPGSVAPTGAPKDTLYLAFAGGDGEVGAYTAAPTNYVNLTVANSSTGGAAATNAFVGGASRGLTASSSEDPGAFTHAAHTTGWTAVTIAVPAPVSGSTYTKAGYGKESG